MKKSLGKEHRKRRALEDAPALIGNGHGLQEAADILRVPYQTLWRWLKELEAAAGDIDAVCQPKRVGRPPLMVLTAEEARKVKEKVMRGMSEVSALRWQCHQGEIRADVAAMIFGRKRKHDIPVAIRRQIHVPKAVKEYNNSPSAFRLNRLSTPRVKAELKDGVIIPDRAGDVFVYDDMTVNFAWWTPWPFADCECSRKHGVKVTRGQLLAALDSYSLRFLHFSLLVRHGESYQGNDIWAEFGRIFRTVGMPRKGITLEGGAWQSKVIHGEKVPGAAEDMRVGGLQRLGIQDYRSYSAKTKPIEGRFNFLQTVMEGKPGNLGRCREGSKEWKFYNRCAAGTLNPTEHLPSQEQMAKAIFEAMAFCNGEPMEGQVHGRPDEIWNAAVMADPLRKPPSDMGWIFARDARVLTKPKSGPLKTRFKQTSGERELYFDHEWLPLLPDKLKVMAHFDPLETGGDAVLINADSKTVVLPDGRQVTPGSLLLVAKNITPSPRVSDVPDANIDLSNGKVKAVRTIQCEITNGKTRGQQMAEAYDGFGNAIRVESGGESGAAAAPMPMVPPRPRREEIAPATSSRALPPGRTRAEEIARLRQLAEAEF